MILKLGNFLNGIIVFNVASTNKGGAIAFKIDAIEKCADMKSGDNQENLLYYAIDTCELILKKEIINEASFHTSLF